MNHSTNEAEKLHFTVSPNTKNTIQIRKPPIVFSEGLDLEEKTR